MTKRIELSEIRLRIKEDGREYALLLLDAIEERARHNETFNDTLQRWLNGEEGCSTVFLRDELCRPFKEAEFLNQLLEQHFYPWDDCWMAIDTYAMKVRLRKYGLLRARFKTFHYDPRPVNWPIKHPYWVTGAISNGHIIVAYADSEDEIMANWPEATDLDIDEVWGYTFTDRFPKPDWFKEQEDAN